ncbi:hypothetical protein FCV25MIE_17992 [Fagus crenata]
MPDQMIWTRTPNGHYSVRSVYHILRQEANRSHAGNSLSSTTNLWSSIWSLPVPPKEVWSAKPHFLTLHTANASSFIDLSWFAMFQDKTVDTTKFAMIAWALWQRRNSLCVNHKAELPDSVLHRAMDLLREFQQANSKVQSHLTQPRIVCGCCPPLTGLHFQFPSIDGDGFGSLYLNNPRLPSQIRRTLQVHLHHWICRQHSS